MTRAYIDHPCFKPALNTKRIIHVTLTCSILYLKHEKNQDCTLKTQVNDQGTVLCEILLGRKIAPY